MTNPKRDTIADLIEKYQKRYDKSDNEAWEDILLVVILQDLTKLQSLPQEADIDKIMENFKAISYFKYDKDSHKDIEIIEYNRIKSVITKHLTQKTTVPKDIQQDIEWYNQRRLDWDKYDKDIWTDIVKVVHHYNKADNTYDMKLLNTIKR